MPEYIEPALWIVGGFVWLGCGLATVVRCRPNRDVPVPTGVVIVVFALSGMGFVSLLASRS